jgi:hypothetical protein
MCERKRAVVVDTTGSARSATMKVPKTALAAVREGLTPK